MSVFTAPDRALSHTQGGAVLIVGMMMVLLMTVVALGAIRGSGMQEQMVGNMRDRQLAFQAAEAALRDGESVIEPSANFVTGNWASSGLYNNLPTWTPYHMVANWSPSEWQSRSAPASTPVGDLAAPPRYLVERIDYSCSSGSAADIEFVPDRDPDVIYRVSSRGVGGSANAAAVLQSTYIFMPCI